MHLSTGASSPLAELPDLPTHMGLLRSLLFLVASGVGSTTCLGLSEAFLPVSILPGPSGPGNSLSLYSFRDFAVPLTLPLGIREEA